MRINDQGSGFKALRVGKDFDGDRGGDRQGIQHIHIAAIETELGDLGVELGSGASVSDFGDGDEGVARSSPLFIVRVIHNQTNPIGEIVSEADARVLEAWGEVRIGYGEPGESPRNASVKEKLAARQRKERRNARSKGDAGGGVP